MTAAAEKEDRSMQAVRGALRAFGHGVPAAEWLGSRNAVFDHSAPLYVAQQSNLGLVRVLAVLDVIAAAKDN